jgi:hypothetical protein
MENYFINHEESDREVASRWFQLSREQGQKSRLSYRAAPFDSPWDQGTKRPVAVSGRWDANGAKVL